MKGNNKGQNVAQRDKLSSTNKDHMLRIRVTAEERERFTRNAKEKGFKSVSDYVRSLVSLTDEEE